MTKTDLVYKALRLERDFKVGSLLKGYDYDENKYLARAYQSKKAELERYVAYLEKKANI